jgi:hypothetical protein
MLEALTMHNYKTACFLFITAVVIISGPTITAFRAQNQANESSPRRSQKMVEQESRLPITNYDEPEPDDPNEKKIREAKAKKYAKTELSIDPDSDVVTTSGHWATGLPAIPVSQSAVIIVGTVSKAKAELTPKRKKVYSEFTIAIDEILKNDDLTPLSSGNIITADRAGGRVRFQSGKVGLYWVTGQGMPQVGKKYLLFLTRTDLESGYSILTGYELRDGRIYLLDNPGSGHPITTTEGTDESSFLNKVRAAVTNP